MIQLGRHHHAGPRLPSHVRQAFSTGPGEGPISAPSGCGFLHVAKWGSDWMFSTCTFTSVLKWGNE